MFLNDQDFRKVIASTPLISIDLIIRDLSGLVLLGERSNSPARGYWFVPGGRIYKNETISEALNRISLSEVGIHINVEDCQLKGVFEHFYEDGFYGEFDSTHYVVLGFETTISPEMLSAPLQQHSAYKWFCELEIAKSCGVHQFTKQYFQKGIL